MTSLCLFKAEGEGVEGGSVEKQTMGEGGGEPVKATWAKENKNGPAAAIPCWYWPRCRSSVAGRGSGCRHGCTGERPVSMVESQANQETETEKPSDRVHLGLLDLVQTDLTCLDLGVAARLGGFCRVLCTIEEQAKVSGDPTGKCWIGWHAGRSWLGGSQDQVGVVGSRSGSGHGTAMQCSIISSTSCRAASASSTAARHGTNRGEPQNRDKEKRTYMLDYAMHAQLVHRDGAQIAQFCSGCKQMID